MLLLWSTGIEYDRVILFISDAAPYIDKSYNSLILTFPKMVHMNCVAHNLHILCETIRNKSPNADFLVNNMKKTFFKSPSRITIFKEKLPLVPLPPSPIINRWGTWLLAVYYMCQHFDKLKDLFLENDIGGSASIDNCTSIFLNNNNTMQEVLEITHNYFFLIQIITNLQRQDISLKDSLEIFENANETIMSVNCSISESVNEKFNQIYRKNKGVQELIDIKNVMRGKTDLTSFRYNLNELNALKFTPITSSDVERVFSIYKDILSDKRKLFKESSMEDIIII